MSLIHDALRDIDAARPARPTGPTGLSHPTGLASPWHEPLPAGAPAARTRPQQAVHAAEASAVGAPIRPEPTERLPGSGGPWLGALASFAVVLGAGWLGWTWWQSQPAAAFSQAALALPPSPAAPTPSPEAPPAVPSAATEAATPAATPPAGGASASGATSAASPSTAPAPAETVAAAPLPAPGSPSTPAAATAAPPPLTRPAPPPRRGAPAARRAAPAPAPMAQPSPPEPPIEAVFAQFSAAIGAQDLAQAEQALAALRARLPAHAVGLLRAQAWFDLQRGQSTAAIESYRTLLQRLPGDEEAAINLASLLLAQQQTEPARQVLQQAAQLNPQSARLREALGRFTPQVQP